MLSDWRERKSAGLYCKESLGVIWIEIEREMSRVCSMDEIGNCHFPR